jgi:P-type Ca2+ transporter type 2B
MHKSNKSLTALGSTADILQFGVKSSDLKELMQLKGQEAKNRIDELFNGVQGLSEKLITNIQTGLAENENDLNDRVKTFGKNEIPPKAPKSIFRLMFEALQDTTLILLIICSFISIGLSFYNPVLASDEDVRFAHEHEANLEWVEGVAILFAVLIVVFVTAFNDWRKERQFRSLKDKIAQDQMASVIRDNQVKQINVKQLVVGDICFIKYGDLIPADGIVVQVLLLYILFLMKLLIIFFFL